MAVVVAVHADGLRSVTANRAGAAARALAASHPQASEGHACSNASARSSHDTVILPFSSKTRNLDRRTATRLFRVSKGSLSTEMKVMKVALI
jgi:hypothetical protein